MSFVPQERHRRRDTAGAVSRGMVRGSGPAAGRLSVSVANPNVARTVGVPTAVDGSLWFWTQSVPKRLTP